MSGFHSDSTQIRITRVACPERNPSSHKLIWSTPPPHPTHLHTIASTCNGQCELATCCVTMLETSFPAAALTPSSCDIEVFRSNVKHKKAPPPPPRANLQIRIRGEASGPTAQSRAHGMFTLIAIRCRATMTTMMIHNMISYIATIIFVPYSKSLVSAPAS